eukprot:tig00001304_g8110.t1
MSAFALTVPAVAAGPSRAEVTSSRICSSPSSPVARAEQASSRAFQASASARSSFFGGRVFVASAAAAPSAFEFTSSIRAETSAPERLASDKGVDYSALEAHLKAGDLRKADDETRRLLCVLTGEDAERRKFLFPDEYEALPTTDLQTIDRLWTENTNGKHGFSVQYKVWKNCQEKFGDFFITIGWKTDIDMNGKLVEGIFRFRKWPQEYIYDDKAPKGHLPLTNHLRGKHGHLRLLSHPAWSS